MIKLTLREKMFYTIGYIVFFSIGMIGLLGGNMLGGLILGVSTIKYIDLLINGKDFITELF